jgi:hypothetical protein
MLGYVFEGQAHGYLIHTGVSVFALLIVASIYYFNGFVKNPPLRSFKGGFILACTVSIALASFAGLYFPTIVIRAAEKAAEGKPYCIALNGITDPKSENMTFFTIKKNNEGHHAFLLVEQGKDIVAYHWSYRVLQFVPGIFYDTAIECKPYKDFSIKILKSKQKRKFVEMYFRGVFLTIPHLYSPSSFTPKELSISAIAPNFHAVTRQDFQFDPSIEFRSRDWIEGLTDTEHDANEAIFSGTWDDFKKTKTLFNRYHVYDAKSQIIAVIKCYPHSRDKSTACQHCFYRDNAMYSFQHSMDLIPQALAMEDALFRLFASFGLKNKPN